MDPGGQKVGNYLLLCKLLIKDGKYEKARKLFECCIAEFGSDFRPYFNFAQLCLLQGDYSSALELLNEALKR